MEHLFSAVTQEQMNDHQEVLDIDSGTSDDDVQPLEPEDADPLFAVLA
jgi:hypothetical protein